MLSPLLEILRLERQEVAREAGIDPATLSRILRGRQYPSIETVKRLETAILRQLAEEETPR